MYMLPEIIDGLAEEDLPKEKFGENSPYRIVFHAFCLFNPRIRTAERVGEVARYLASLAEDEVKKVMWGKMAEKFEDADYYNGGGK